MAYRPTLSASVPFELVGTAAVVDLESACELYGRDSLPFPLSRSRPVGSVWLATREVEPIDDRLNDGDLRGLRAWVEALVRSDVCVECRVHYFDVDAPDLRLHGLRSGEFGFAAVQGRDGDGVDVVDIYAVSPEMLGAVVAGTVGLVGAGAKPRIAVAEGVDRLPPSEVLDEYDDFGFLIPQAGAWEPAVAVVDRRDVVATGTVQSLKGSSRHWSPDSERRILEWVQIEGDGDYVCEPGDTGHAEPLDRAMLRDYIDGFIAEDMRTVRERRGLA